MSNAYMIEVDICISRICQSRGALYQRYSDDILIACNLQDEIEIKSELISVLLDHKLRIKEEKTERTIFTAKRHSAFQYLGFNISPQGACIRPGSLSRQWRKLRRSIRKIQFDGREAIKSGKSTMIYTKSLRKKLSPVGARNFSSYARRCAVAFNSKAILRQVRRLEREADQAIRALSK